MVFYLEEMVREEITDIFWLVVVERVKGHSRSAESQQAA